MSGSSPATKTLSLISCVALTGALAACSPDNEPQIDTIDPNDLETEEPAQNEVEEDEAAAEPAEGSVCELLSPDDFESVIGELMNEGQATGEPGQVESCEWPHPEVDFQGATLLSLSDGEIAGEDLFESVASGEPTEVEGADEALFDEESESLWIRSDGSVLQLYLYAFQAEEDEFVELGEIMVGNL